MSTTNNVDISRGDPGRTHRPGTALAVALIALAAVVAFYPAFSSSFVCDDLLIVVHNPRTKSLDLWTILTTSYWGDQDRRVSLYRPLTILSLAFDRALAGAVTGAGLNPAMYHATNLAAHLLCCLAVYVLMRRHFGGAHTALFAGLLFAVHPVHSDVVYGIVNRSDSFATLFVVIGIILYLDWRKGSGMGPLNWRLVGANVCYLFALGFKEMAVTLPLLLLLADLVMFESGARAGRLSALFRRYCGFAIVLAAHVVLRAVCVGRLGSGLQTFAGVPAQTRMLTMYVVVADYLRALFFPFHMSADYPYNQWPATFHTDLYDARVVAALFVIGAAMLVGLALAVRRQRAELFWFIFFWAALLPVLNIVPISVVKGERMLYLPSIGACALAGAAVYGLWRRSRVVAGVGLLVVIASFAVLCRMQGQPYRSQSSFANYLCRVQPRFPFAYYLRARNFGDAGRIDAEIADYGLALALMPDYKNALHSRALARCKRSDFAGAEQDFRALIELPPVNPRVHGNLGWLLMTQGRFSEAIVEYNAALALVDAKLEMDPGRTTGSGAGSNRAVSRPDMLRQALLDYENDDSESNPIRVWEYAEILANRGRAYIGARDHATARGDIIMSLQIAQHDIGTEPGRERFTATLSLVAECNLALRLHSEAALDLKRLAELVPERRAALLLKELECWLACGELENAREAASRLEQAGGTVPDRLKVKLEKR
ncbi:MAG: hypothetical protein RDV41_01705 [Planctomycetota bacterium]|nr:hypothetical protein [Planctomycetota bacterium]